MKTLSEFKSLEAILNYEASALSYCVLNSTVQENLCPKEPVIQAGDRIRRTEGTEQCAAN